MLSRGVRVKGDEDVRHTGLDESVAREKGQARMLRLHCLATLRKNQQVMVYKDSEKASMT